jgi:hypothetical protein
MPDLPDFAATWYHRDKFVAQSERTASRGIRSGMFVPRPALMRGAAARSADIPSEHQSGGPEEPAGSG